MKALTIALSAIVGSSTAAFAQDAAPPAVVTHHVVHTHTVTHNDGRPHRKITHVRHRTTIKTPTGTLVKTTTSTTKTTPN